MNNLINYFQKGSAAEYKKKKPNYIVKYEKDIPANVRIDKIIEWITLKKEPANFALLYLFDLDNGKKQKLILFKKKKIIFYHSSCT